MKNSKLYKRYRFPSEIIQYAVWLYYRFNLSHRDIQDLLAERGITVTYEGLLSDDAIQQLFDLFWHIEEQEDVGQLYTLLDWGAGQT